MAEKDIAEKKLLDYADVFADIVNVTLVLYFGYQTRWDKARRLKECFEIPEPLEPYVNDYPLHVIEVAWLPDETIAKFQSDFKLVADYFSQMRKDETYDPMPDEIRHVRETLDLLSVLSGDERFWESGKDVKRGERFTMRSVALDRIEARGAARGEKRGREQTWVASVRNLMKSMQMTAQQAAEALAVPAEIRQKVLEQV